MIWKILLGPRFPKYEIEVASWGNYCYYGGIFDGHGSAGKFSGTCESAASTLTFIFLQTVINWIKEKVFQTPLANLTKSTWSSVALVPLARPTPSTTIACRRRYSTEM